MQQTSLFVLFFMFISYVTHEKSTDSGLGRGKQYTTEWVLSDFILKDTNGIKIKGNPVIVNCKYGKAVQFNGSCDGIFLEPMPLKGLEQFTIEVIFHPDSGGNFEQRFFHCGEVKGNRVLLETRSTKEGWYFDAFIKSEISQKALIDPNLLHPFNYWYHVAFVISKGKIETYINGQNELEYNMDILSIKGGKTSIGVRQNEQSWFKGAIYKIRISPEPLTPDKFIPFHN
jgi:hypothetical protein